MKIEKSRVKKLLSSGVGYSHKNNDENLRERYVFVDRHSDQYICIEGNIAGFIESKMDFSDSINWLNEA